MPPKKKGGAGKKKGKKAGGKKAAAAAAEREEAVRVCRSFVKAYQQRCSASESVASVRVVRDCKACLESETALAKFVFESTQGERPPQPSLASVTASPSHMGHPGSPSPPSSPSDVPSASVSPGLPREDPSLTLQPLVDAWSEVKYSYMRCLHVWSVDLPDEDIVALAIFIESRLGTNLKVLELMETRLSPWAINRLARSLGDSQLTVLRMDYQNIPLVNLAALCSCLQHCRTLQSLNLEFCRLGPECGEHLGTLATVGTIRDLNLRGNQLQCEGVVELVRPVVAMLEAEEPCPPPLARLHLQDNSIDDHGSGGTFEPVICARVIKKLLLKSVTLEELNLEGNLIGDGGGREIMHGLQERKEINLPATRVTITHRLSSELFSQIVALGTAKKGKAKKGGKKKGKKR